MYLTGRLALVVAAATLVVAVAVRSFAGLLAVDAAIALVALVDALLAPSPRGLTVRREGAATTRLREPAVVTLVLRGGPRTLVGAVRDAWPPSAGAARTRTPVTVPGGRVVRVATTLTPTRRGVRAPDRVTIRSVGPLGLAGRQVSLVVPWALRVLPAFPSRRHLPSRLARLRELDGRTALQVRGQGTEFDSLREYVAGDDVRSIDWRSTARAADVMVRTWRPERDRRVVLVLDTGRTSAARLGDGTRLDAAMDAAQLLGALASHAGDRVDLIAYARGVRADVRGGARPALLAEIAAALTDVAPELVETDAAGLVAAVLTRVRQRALVVLLTPLEPAALRAGLLPVLPTLTARHLVVVASVRDPRLSELAEARGDVDDAYAAAAAGTDLAARARAADLLVRLGVEVVDAGPDELAPALADRYLALKAAGRL